MSQRSYEQLLSSHRCDWNLNEEACKKCDSDSPNERCYFIPDGMGVAGEGNYYCEPCLSSILMPFRPFNRKPT